MKPSEMTNEELAKELMSRVPLDSDKHDDLRAAAARLRKIDSLLRRLKVAEDALKNSPCGEVYQLGLVDDDGNCYNGIAIKFDEAEGLKLPLVGHGDRFVVVSYSALAAIRAEEEKPESCPECNSKCELMKSSVGDFFVGCSGCYYRIGGKKTEAEAIAAHNRVARAVKAARESEKGE